MRAIKIKGRRGAFCVLKWLKVNSKMVGGGPLKWWESDP